jgi:NAD(P)H-dependent flavin oxidoreductase YrpB (nitropropane dioxygenase family)
MIRTALCDLLAIDIPILQAGMGTYRGVVTPPALVAAVSEAGGLGTLGGAGLLPEELRVAIRQVRSLTTRPFGVDLIIPAELSAREGTRDEIRADIRARFPRHSAWAQELFERFGLPSGEIDMGFTWTEELTHAQARVVIEERVPVFVIALGDPRQFMPACRDAGIKVAGLVGSLGNLRRQLEAGVDFIIAQGAEAGGHTGVVATMPLVPQVVDAAGSVPVVAAGGIADGRGVAAALMLGAAGAWCGTAFLAAEEATLHPTHREQILQGRSEDFAVSRIYTGKPARTYRNEIHRLWAEAGLEPLGMPHQKVLMEDFLDACRKHGRLELASNPCGQVAGMLHGTKPAATILTDMAAGAAAALRHGAALLA